MEIAGRVASLLETRHRLPPRLQRPAECGHGRAAHGGLGAGTYTLTIAVHSDATHLANNYDWWDKVIGFQIVPGSESPFIGSAWLPARFHVERRGRGIASAHRDAGEGA